MYSGKALLDTTTTRWVDNGYNEPASTPTIAVIQTGTPLILITTSEMLMAYKPYTEAHIDIDCTQITDRILIYLAHVNIFRKIMKQMTNKYLKQDADLSETSTGDTLM